ncbi:uncharacterized protein LOC110622321 isoform X2 [Manihot esculenta]|uniref:Uncharacterized protein n=1 Tax=Manihot esculenta TaxID=3983 RepID=A0A2C9V8X0_MANES|nr:uncharacterized protein LOC110622321 isoform X2 [Manihot esculenta]
MANTTTNNLSDNCDHKESSPLLDKSIEEHNKKPTTISGTKVAASPMEKEKSAALELGRSEYVWTANGLPLNHGSVVGEPMGRAQWDSSSSDHEVSVYQFNNFIIQLN